MLGASLDKLFQESHITLKKQLNIIDPIFQHRDSLHTHAKSEAADFIRIVAVALHKLEHCRIDHAATQKLDPSAVLAQSAALAATFKTRYRNVGARFREGKERRKEARLYIRTEERFHGVIQSAFEITKSNIGIHGQAFDLMKDR